MAQLRPSSDGSIAFVLIWVVCVCFVDKAAAQSLKDISSIQDRPVLTIDPGRQLAISTPLP
jgi:hypothetical protein